MDLDGPGPLAKKIANGCGMRMNVDKHFLNATPLTCIKPDLQYRSATYGKQAFRKTVGQGPQTSSVTSGQQEGFQNQLTNSNTERIIPDSQPEPKLLAQRAKESQRCGRRQ